MSPAPHRLALSGRIVTMDAADTVIDDGVVYVEGDRIVDVREESAPPPDGFAAVDRRAVRGTIYPGMIELHNHLPYDVLPLWHVPQLFTNRGQWGRIAEYRQKVTGPMSVIGRYPGLMPAVVRYVECKCLVAGVTTSQGIALFSNAGRRFYDGVVRNVERTDRDELPAAKARISDIDAEDAPRFLERLASGDVLILHLAEGVDDSARQHFLALQVSPDVWALSPELAGIHAAALTPDDLSIYAEHGASVIWSPLSNLLLYGGTTDIESAVEAGVRIGLGSDWSVTGSKNLLGELKVARLVSRELGGLLSDRDIVAMATRNAASILKWDAALGSIEPGKLADLFVLHGDDRDPYAALLDAREADISLVMIGGIARFGTPAFTRRLGEGDAVDDPGEDVRVGGRDRVLRLAAAADPAVGAISFARATEKLTDALGRLPELALALEEGTVIPEFAPPPALAAGEPTWFLALDELADTGFALRPHLRGPDGEPTGPQLESLLPTAAAISEIVDPTELDPLTVDDDSDFFEVIEAQPNLPDFVRSQLGAQYTGAT